MTASWAFFEISDSGMFVRLTERVFEGTALSSTWELAFVVAWTA